MIERLYCPDFSALFNPRHANPFAFHAFDTLQWPLLTDVPQDDRTKALLAVKDERGHPVFYHRKISSGQWNVERACAGIGFSMFQAFHLDGSAGISNDQVLAACKAVGSSAAGIICPVISPDGLREIDKARADIAGVVFYPLFQDIDVGSPDLRAILERCAGEGLPVKWDFFEWATPKKSSLYQLLPGILALMAEHRNITFIFSGLELSGIQHVAEKMKYYPRAWIELDPRVIGGLDPATFFTSVFSLPGFVQNCWSRVVLGSATPTLEASQVSKGLLDATARLPFHQRSLLRAWLPRNAARLFPHRDTYLAPGPWPGTFPFKTWVESFRHVETQGKSRHVTIDIEATLQSFSITQLLWIQPLIEEIWASLKKDFASVLHGRLLVRSYHTTTSLIMNEHEHGNYLQLHYDLAERTMSDPSTALHTVAAEENRADFNYPDHFLASSVGSRDITIPITNGSLALGGRENAYVLVTFGPRAVSIKLRFELVAA